MKPHQGILKCVECFVRLSAKKPDTGVRDRQRQRMEMKRKETEKMGVKYGSAEHVEVVDDKSVISEEKISHDEAEKIASGGAGDRKKIGSRRSTVTDKDFKRTDEDHIPGD